MQKFKIFEIVWTVKIREKPLAVTPLCDVIPFYKGTISSTRVCSQRKVVSYLNKSRTFLDKMHILKEVEELCFSLGVK